MEKIKITEESTDNISDYGKNERRIPVDQLQVTYFSSFAPYDYATNESFKLQDIMCNLLKRQCAPDPIHYHYFVAIFKILIFFHSN